RPRARAVPMERPSDELLAGARFHVDQRGQIARGDLDEEATELVHLRRAADQQPVAAFLLAGPGAQRVTHAVDLGILLRNPRLQAAVQLFYLLLALGGGPRPALLL